MSPWLTFAVTLVGIILIPIVVLLWRVAVGATHLKDQIENMEKDIKDLVENKDKTHQTIFESMKEDRRATDRRLRWLEENVWKERQSGTS